ncbi:MAG: hypothetical protein ACLGI3_11465, partial [Actinomycetes bacterium]
APYAAPVVVGEDPEGDFGDADTAPLGAALGMDLVSASIGMRTADTVDFVIEVSELLATGGTPEVARYTWSMLVDGRFVELDGKWSNYSRGVCDPTSGQCPPPRDPGMHPFFVRGDCVTGEGNVTTCREIGTVNATFDAAAATITIPVPVELLGAGPCSVITEGPNMFGDSISAAPAAFVTSTAMPADTLWTEFPFEIPSGDPQAPCGAEVAEDDLVEPAAP